MRIWVVLVVCVLFAVPAAAQEAGLRNPVESTPSILYFHLDGLADFPITPEPPTPGFTISDGGGLARTSACVPDNPATTLASQSMHTLYGYSAWGPIQYVEETDRLVQSTGRGLGYDALLDTNQTAQAFWYLETETGGDAGFSQAPVIVPAVHVSITVRSGDNLSVNDQAYEAGALIASGDSGRLFLDPTGLTPGAASAANVGGRTVYEIPVALDLQEALLRADTGYNVRVDVWMDSPCPGPSDGYLMPNMVRHHSSDDHRPRLEWSVLNPLRIEFLKPFLDHDIVSVVARASTPWGPTGIDPESIELRADGPEDAALDLIRRHEGHESWAPGYEPVHVHRAEPANVEFTWAWTNAPDSGSYAFTLALADRAGVNATATALLNIGQGTATAATLDGLQVTALPGAKEAPGPAAVLPLLILALAAFVARRR